MTAATGTEHQGSDHDHQQAKPSQQFCTIDRLADLRAQSRTGDAG
jgi:hypothetical protein